MPLAEPLPTAISPIALGAETDRFEAEILLILTVIDARSLDTLEATVAMINHNDQSVLGGTRNKHGDYEINFTNQDYAKYNVKINREGYLPYDSKLHVIGHGNQDHTIFETVALMTIKESFTGIMNVFFVIDSAEPNSFDDLLYLEYLMKDNPNLKVEISGHTDNTGTEEYNKILSQRRADAIKNYLTAHDIDGARINSVGYGIDKPIGDNNTRIGRRLNRRTEFKILQR
jgi:outer membrane protein OmpA-like peptidoglycan-associated protein